MFLAILVPMLGLVATAVARDVAPIRDVDGLRHLLRQVIDNQHRIELAARDRKPPCPPSSILTTPAIRGVEPVVVMKGESVTVRLGFAWRQYPTDTVTVKVAASDPSLKVPEKLELDFENHATNFEFMVTAGDKAGEFLVTLTPGPGQPVIVSVTVR